MQNLGVELNPITKIRIFREVKKMLFSQMDNNKITPDRVEEILLYIKKYILSVNSPELSKKFYIHLSEKFVELAKLKIKFELEEKEKTEEIISLFLGEIMEKGNIELADEIMIQLEKNHDKEKFINELKEKFPIEFLKIIKK